ncbi:MAG: hypothetical protein ACI9N1_002662 [Flavobacteriales bacterium]|jgi:hypothetical protein
MKFILTILFFLFICLNGQSQIIPLGFIIGTNGTIEVQTSEPNYNGNLTNPVYVIFDSDTTTEDLRNVKYYYLTILEAPKHIYPSNLDPSYQESNIELDSIYQISDLPL